MNEDGLGGTDADLSQSTDAPAVFTGDNVLSSLVTRATSAWIPSETAPQCPFHVGENTSSVHIWKRLVPTELLAQRGKHVLAQRLAVHQMLPGTLEDKEGDAGRGHAVGDFHYNPAATLFPEK